MGKGTDAPNGLCALVEGTLPKDTSSKPAVTFSREWPIGLPLRASNEGSPRPRVARAQETNKLPLVDVARNHSTWMKRHAGGLGLRGRNEAASGSALDDQKFVEPAFQ
jgi:hypothetical protein